MLSDIRSYLIAQGLVEGATGWKLYAGYFPDDQDQMVGLFDLPGMPADTLGRENRRLMFQLRVRAARLDYAVAVAKWQELFDALQDAQSSGVSPDYLAGYVFIQATSVSPMVFYDDNGRPNLTTGFRVMKYA